MDNRVRFRPFTGDTGRQVRLENAPLALVLLQVRWPSHSQFERDFEALALDFGDGLEEFPLFDRIHENGVQITPEGVSAIEGATAYRWRSIDDVWTVSLTRNFVSLYCSPHAGYQFSEMRDHLGRVVELMETVLRVKRLDRVGLRYVNRISQPDVMSALNEVFDSRVLGHAGLQDIDGVQHLSSASQATYQVEEILFQTRSGLIPAGQTVDQAIPPLNGPSWVLDIDASVNQNMIFDAERLGAMISRLADVDYDFFRLVVKDGEEAKLDGSA